MTALAGAVRATSRLPRWWTNGVRSRLWWAAALVSTIAVPLELASWFSNGAPSGVLVIFGVGMIGEVVVGLLFWMWRPGNAVGPLLVAYVLLMMCNSDAFPMDSRLGVTVGNFVGFVFWPIYVLVLFLFPNGELFAPRWVRPLLAVQLVWALAISVPSLLFVRTGIPTNFGVSELPSYFYVGHGWSGLVIWQQVWWVGQLVLTLVVDALLIARLRRATPGARRRLVPLYSVVLVLLTFNFAYATAQQLAGGDFLHWSGWFPYVWISFAAFSAAGAAFGLGRVRHARSSVSDLVVELGEVEPGGVRDALARTLGDPSLVLGLWLPERQGWADESGREIAVPEDESCGVTYVGERLAVLIHDRDLLDQPRLLESVGSAARLALENERLQAELRAQLAELRESRARIVAVGDEERRRLERDLHDGAQQRLLGLGMALQLLRPHLVDGDELLDETEAELQSALAELRELARGIHPAVLTDQGLDAALRTLAERAPLRVTVEGAAGRLPAHVETAAYFVAAEALANVTKHAHATSAMIRVDRDAESLTLEIADDGVGGAHAEDGSGLRGLADRVGALNGRLTVNSPPRAGTRVRVSIPS